MAIVKAVGSRGAAVTPVITQNKNTARVEFKGRQTEVLGIYESIGDSLSLK